MLLIKNNGEKKVWYLTGVWNEEFIYHEYTLKSVIDEICFQVF